MDTQPPEALETADHSAAAASELNNLLHIISGTADILDNIWHDSPVADKYVAMLRTSIDRAVSVTSELIGVATRSDDKIVLHPAVFQQVSRPYADSTPSAAPRARPRPLVVDDEPMVLTVAEDVLTREGFDVTTAANGCECLNLFSANPASFAIVILDLAMPLMNGEETFDRLQAIAPNVRVLLHTGFVEDARAAAMLARGLLGVLPKPLRGDEYAAIIRSTLANADSATTALSA